MAPRLPLELLERIIDDVTKYGDSFIDNLSSIKSCALVCHSFLPLCRNHIFANVTLNSPVVWGRTSSPTSDDFNHLLSNSPHLAVYIRKLDYFVSKNEFVPNRSQRLLSIFKKLVKLQKLSISYYLASTIPGTRLDWMSPSVRKVLLPLLHLPTLTSIRLSAIRNFPLADLARCVNLRKLRIQSLECSSPNGVGNFLEALLPATPVMLERLAIEEGNVKPVRQLCQARRPDGKPIIDFSSLKKFTATVARLDSMTELFANGMWRNLRKIKLSRTSLPTFLLPLHPFDDVTLITYYSRPWTKPPFFFEFEGIIHHAKVFLAYFGGYRY